MRPVASKSSVDPEAAIVPRPRTARSTVGPWLSIARWLEPKPDDPIDILIDDSPVNLENAVKAGITAATIEHPWNRDVPNVISAPDWATLKTRLEPLLA